MSKQQVYNKVQARLAAVPPPPKTWQTPIYHLDHYTLRRHTHVITIQLVGVRGNEKRTESISLPLLPGITDGDYIRAATWFSPNKWRASFRVDMAQFGGKFSQPVDMQLLQALMGPSIQGPRQQPELHNAPTLADAAAFSPQFRSPSLQPGQFRQVPMNNRFPSPSASKTRGSFRQWYRSRTRGVKVGIWCGAVLGVLVLLSLLGTALGTGATATLPASSPTSQAAAPTPPSAVASLPTPRPSPTTAKTAPTPRPTPKPTPTAKPTVVAIKPTQVPPTPIPPTPTACPGVNCNPWGYNFSPGNLIYTPPSNFCAYFNCIPSFWEPDDPGDGYIVECSDGMYSQSGGESGACSYHGGVGRPLYSH